jgi:hypothetical protein
MVNKKLLVASSAIIVLLVCGVFVAISLRENKVNPLNELIGTYRGSYTAAQGLTGLTLEVYKNDAGAVEAIFEFYPDPGNPYNHLIKSGKYVCSVNFDSNATTYSITGFRWIEQPSTYFFVDLEGSLSEERFTGEVYLSDEQVGSFDVVRI